MLTKSTQRIIVVAWILSNWLGLCSSAEASDSDVSMKISSVSNRADVPIGSPLGIMMLAFSNRSAKNVVVPFWSPIGLFRLNLVYKDKYPTRNFELQDSQGNENDRGAIISHLIYEWTSEYGNVISSAYDINDTELSLKPNQTNRIMVPINVPTKAGLYHLRVRFDNRAIQRAESTFNNKYAVYGEPDALKYFEATDQVSIKVGN